MSGSMEASMNDGLSIYLDPEDEITPRLLFDETIGALKPVDQAASERLQLMVSTGEISDYSIEDALRVVTKYVDVVYEPEEE
jgi:hypothetical protein